MTQIYFILILWTVPHIMSQSFQPTFLDNWFLQFRTFRNIAFKSIGRNSENSLTMNRARQLHMLQQEVPQHVPFPCNVSKYRSLKPPTSVHKVRPGDIDVIAAIGDSLTVGNGLVATDLLQVFMENRGLSWSIGGQHTWRQYVTLPNILKEFNPNLIGYSLRDSLSTHRDSQFNVAEAAGVSSETPYMTKVLIKRIKSDRRVNYKQHWKLVTLMIGANDFCLDICYQNDLNDFCDKHRKDLMTVLRLLKDNLPRTIVNLVPAPDVFILRSIKNKPKQCTFANRIECYCLFGSKYQQKLNAYRQAIKQWTKIEEQIAALPEFQQNDFAVVFQPFTLNIDIPKDSKNKTDLSNLSQDCFHLSQKFNAAVANSLWNNMLEPVGHKTKTSTALFEPFLCPTDKYPYIFTNVNSSS